MTMDALSTRSTSSGDDEVLAGRLLWLLHEAARDFAPSSAGVGPLASHATDEIQAPTILSGLAAAGHHVVVLSPWVEANPVHIYVASPVRRVQASGVRSRRAWVPRFVMNDD